ncbi:MAG TPA: type II toxin-antitoxin system VapC family toxin [Caulobacteraceae bacterium]
MSRFVIDASVALKWVIPETGSAEALMFRWAKQLLAPDLIMAECGNAIWKKARRGEFTPDDAHLGVRLLEQSDIELRPMRSLLAPAMRFATGHDHPAYDCFYLALAEAEECPFVTADESLVRKVATSRLAGPLQVLSLGEAAKLIARP